MTRRGEYIYGPDRGETRDKLYICVWALLGWDTLQSSVFVVTQIWTGVSWFWWQLIEAV